MSPALRCQALLLGLMTLLTEGSSFVSLLADDELTSNEIGDNSWSDGLHLPELDDNVPIDQWHLEILVHQEDYFNSGNFPTVDMVEARRYVYSNRTVVEFCTIQQRGSFIKIMQCESRGLTEIPNPSKTLYDITSLNLFNNSISALKNGSFCRFPKLVYLSLTRNNISSLDVGAFDCLFHLKGLFLKSNNLIMRKGMFPDGVFKPLINLQLLKINNNTLTSKPPNVTYPDTALQDLTKLTWLYMDGLPDLKFGPGFAKMSSLCNLTLAGQAEGYCRLETIKDGMFDHLGHITNLNISDCYIMGENLHEGPLKSMRNLTTLDLTYNVNIGIEKVPYLLKGLYFLKRLYMNSVVTRFSRSIAITANLTKSLPRRLKYLEAKENCFETIEPNAFYYLPQYLTYINLGSNRLLFGKYLKYIYRLKNLKFLEMSRDTYVYRLPTKYPFNFGRDKDPITYPFNFGNDEIPYSMDPYSILRTENLSAGDTFIIKLPPHLTKFRMNTAGLVYFLSELRIDPNNSLQELSISQNFFPSAYGPITGLHKLRYLDLSHCSLQKIDHSFFSYFPSLTILKLSYNNLNYAFSSSSGNIFNNLTNLTYLDISYNRLSSLPVNVFSGLSNLQKLHMESNKLTAFDVDISHMESLKILKISDLQLPTLPVPARQHIDYLRLVKKTDLFVDMSLNPIHCDCENLAFLEWMVACPAFDKHFLSYQCLYPDTSLKNITDGYAETIEVLQRQCAQNYPVFLVVISVTILLFGCVAVVIAYRFRWKIRYFYYAAYLKMKKNKEKNENLETCFKYDVFLSYSHKDTTFVLSQLLPELESRGLKLHVHGRDFLVGDYIASNIAAAVMESRKTLVVLTKEFLKSHWCNYEIQMANSESIETGRQVLVFLIAEVLTTEELGKELLNHIKNNTFTCYPINGHLGDHKRLFWDKLASDLKQ